MAWLCFSSLIGHTGITERPPPTIVVRITGMFGKVSGHVKTLNMYLLLLSAKKMLNARGPGVPTHQ